MTLRVGQLCVIKCPDTGRGGPSGRTVSNQCTADGWEFGSLQAACKNNNSRSAAGVDEEWWGPSAISVAAPLLPPPGAAETQPVTSVHIHVIVDHSVVEVIVNNRTAAALSNVAPSNASYLSASIFGAQELWVSVQSWHLAAPS